jgi:Peptidase propeptide and YPEB domain
MPMSKHDINNQIGIKYKTSRNIIAGIFVGIIAAIGIIGMSNISAQEMGNAATTTNATSQMGEQGNLTGSIDVEKTIAEVLKSKVTVNIIDAITTAQNSVGPNATAKEAELTEAHGYLVYKIKIIDEDMKKYKVIVDPGNGQVLMNKEITWYDEHEKMKYGDEKGDKYGHDNKMMMKDKKY